MKIFIYLGMVLLLTGGLVKQATAQCVNVAEGKPATASGSYLSSVPASAFDSNCSTGWNNGNFPPGWIQVDLQGSFTIHNINLQTSMVPSGFAAHSIAVAPSPSGPFTTIDNFSGAFVNNQIFERCFDTNPLTNVGAIRVSTSSSPSWLAWIEIQAFSVSPNANANITASGSLSIAPGDSVILTATADRSYQWSTGETTQSIVVKTSGNYSVTVGPDACNPQTTACSACFGTASVNVSQSGASIPTMSQWGLVILALLILCVGAVTVSFRRSSSAMS